MRVKWTKYPTYIDSRKYFYVRIFIPSLRFKQRKDVRYTGLTIVITTSLYNQMLRDLTLQNILTDKGKVTTNDMLTVLTDYVFEDKLPIKEAIISGSGLI